jgi:hypothetical protein
MSAAVSQKVSNAAASANKKRTYDELGNHDGDDDDESDKNTMSGLAAFFHYAQANHKKVKAALSSENAKAKAIATFGKVAEELANNYRALSAAEITEWQEIAVTSDVDFVKEMKPYSEPTKARKKKDPDAPKGPVSAFFHYMMAIRSTISAEDPNMAFGDVTKECAKRFKAISNKDKKEWEEKATADKVRYKSQLEVYDKEQEAKNKTQENSGDENEDDHEDTNKPNKKTKKAPAQEHDKEKTEENAGKQTEDGPDEADKPKKKKAKKTPTQKDDAEKTPQDAGNLKEDSPKEADKPQKNIKKNKRKTLTGEEQPKKKSKVKDDDDHAKTEKPKKKEKRSADAPRWYRPGYALYMEEKRETIKKDNPDLAHSEISKLGSINFKALPDKEHQKWMDKAVADKARFDQEMEVYNSKLEHMKDEGGDECDV